MKNAQSEVIEICGLPFKLIYRERNSRSDTSMGKCDIKDLEIYIDKDMPDEQRKASLVHEWIHAVLDLNGVEAHEVVVSVLGTELYRSGFRV